MKIRITSGTYGYRPNGSKVAKRVTCGDAPIDVSEKEAKRLIGMGVAVYADEVKPTGEGGGSGDGKSNTGGDGKPKYHAGMRTDDLKALMKEAGLEYADGMTRKEMVAVLDAHYAEPDDDDPGDDGEGGGSGDDGEKPPITDLGGPVV
jgi:hypothetical protein